MKCKLVQPNPLGSFIYVNTADQAGVQTELHYKLHREILVTGHISNWVLKLTAVCNSCFIWNFLHFQSKMYIYLNKFRLHMWAVRSGVTYRAALEAATQVSNKTNCRPESLFEVQCCIMVCAAVTGQQLRVCYRRTVRCDSSTLRACELSPRWNWDDWL